MSSKNAETVQRYDLIVKSISLILLVGVVGLSLYIRYISGHYSSYGDFLDAGRLYLILAAIELAAGIWAILGKSLPFLLSSSALLLIGIISENREAPLYLALLFSSLFIAYFELAHLGIKLSHTSREDAKNRPYVVRTHLRSLTILLFLGATTVFLSANVYAYIEGYGIAMLRTVYGFMLASCLMFATLLVIREVMRYFIK